MKICVFDVIYVSKFWPFSAGQGSAMDNPVKILLNNHSNESANQELSIGANISVARHIKM